MHVTLSVHYFSRLLGNKKIKHFFRHDPCGALCDKYHVATVFQLFARANFLPYEYTVKNFFLCLALSHDLYDEFRLINEGVIVYYMIIDPSITRKKFNWDKLRLFKRMGFQGISEEEECDKVCDLFKHYSFHKQRTENHKGIMRLTEMCQICGMPSRIDVDEARRRLWALRMSSRQPFRCDPTPQKFFGATIKANLALTVC